jgi:hypothetical protein
MKLHKLVIETLDNGFNETCAFFSKGIHDPIAFKTAVASEAGCLPDEVKDPKYEWWRWRPARKDEQDCYSINRWQMEAEPFAIGAFVVTVSRLPIW